MAFFWTDQTFHFTPFSSTTSRTAIALPPLEHLVAIGVLAELGR
jgi:hypothetical protein